MATTSGDHTASGGGVGCTSGEESACSTPFVSALMPSSPTRDPSFSDVGCFYSAPMSPACCGPGTVDEDDGCELGFNFDFSLRCPSPTTVVMSSADELFHNSQIQPMWLTSFLLRPQALPPLDRDVPLPPLPSPHERGRLYRSLPMPRRYHCLSLFHACWLSPSSSPAPVTKSMEPAAAGEAEAASSASRSSSSSSSASSASSSSSSRSYYRMWDLYL
ncbi:uncharacterized protein [Miscanthus floridulus]|uniref:uncharacterized protein n=1 Tax=Miscanthus floridulus TaxID=154761 RepID=UPI00345B1B73